MEEKLLLSVKDLRAHFPTRGGVIKAVDGVSFDLAPNEVIALVGESGCGKSITVKALLRLLRGKAKTEGQALFTPKGGKTVDLMPFAPTGKDIRTIRGKHINMIFQEPMNALSPVHTIGNQITEALRLHLGMDQKAADKRAIELLSSVGIPEPEKRLSAYSFMLSGGMRQRVLIAMAIACDPELLIADEPTTALDVSVQAQILKLLKDLQKQTGMGMIFITHDMAVVAQMVDRVCVMYLGRIVEMAPVGEIFEHPLHPYTRRLMDAMLDPSVPRSDEPIRAIAGSVPEPINLPCQCHFYKRCQKRATASCENALPELTEVSPGHFVRCHSFRQGESANE